MALEVTCDTGVAGLDGVDLQYSHPGPAIWPSHYTALDTAKEDSTNRIPLSPSARARDDYQLDIEFDAIQATNTDGPEIPESEPAVEANVEPGLGKDVLQN